ncbi:MAG: oxidoreductase [Brachybacterium faecium]|nr:MAG: oxidoreductase [Brachybacterium faecium]
MASPTQAPRAAPQRSSGTARTVGPGEARPTLIPRPFAVLSAIVGAGVLVALAELFSLLLPGTSAPASPFVAVGGAFIDMVPAAVKDLVISLFGTADKLLLFLCMGAVYALLAAGIGLLGRRSRPLAALALAGLALLAALVVITRPGTSLLDAVPTLLGALAGSAVLHRMLGLAPPAPDSGMNSRTTGGGAARRRFLITAAGTAVAALAVGVPSRLAGSARAAAEAARARFRPPAPAVVAAPIPPEAQVRVPGMPSFLTPADDFYRIDTALAVPRVDPTTWSLRITGLVDHELTLTFEQLLAEPMTEAHVTLACVSNSVGGDLVGNATWLGVPIRTLLERAGVQDGADMVLSCSVDGFTASTPLEALTDDRASLLAVAMNGEPLPPEHGYPVRMVVPGLYGYVSATKWVEELKVTRFADDRAYWSDRGWSERGPIKTACRLDVPEQGVAVEAGTVELGGTAWAPHRGIAEVQVQIDDGDWQQADLGASANDDCWRQWSLTWEDALPGEHTVTVRAVDGTGQIQTSQRANPAPDGASGWHTVPLRVR